MIKQSLEAVFENGVFRPLAPRRLSIPEGQQVRLTVETPESSAEVLALATHVYDGLSEQQIEEIEQVALNRRDWFGDEFSA